MRVITTDNNGVLQAAEVIRSGGLVALPTETVYGLGADAFNAEAVAKIYATKGRPGDNPLILHIANAADTDKIAADMPDYARGWMTQFWPGPLTLVVRKKEGLPAWLGGHPDNAPDTVGIRVPAHPVMRAVIEAAGCVIAAPSANIAGKPSPTCAAHILTDYESAALTPDLLLDGGAVDVGVESTVVDITGDTPVILRHGAVTAEMLGILNEKTQTANGGQADALVNAPTDAAAVPRSPGMKYRHYAPNAPMTLLSGTPEAVASYITTQIISELDAYIGVMVSPQVKACMDKNWPMMAVQTDGSYVPLVSTILMGSSDAPHDTARDLFANLRKFDALGVDIILAEAVPAEGLGAAIIDRMTKAAEGRIIQVGSPV
ncbi:MAG: L-threonylcarbamoyladenylate synthase [Defluviitaleaceae bacterium]|nr:L-threonylcarbamoyladenylate synthase [Defluviitaleaceae bacterium]